MNYKSNYSFIRTIEQLSYVLKIKSSDLFRVIELVQLNNDGLYYNFKIRKKNGGIRNIHSPTLELKIIQRVLSDFFIRHYQNRKCVHGFVTDRSIVTNAIYHVGKRCVFNIDLKDFFPSISFEMIITLLTGNKFFFSSEIAEILTKICTYQYCLPQGAPTSPILSNFICENLDYQLQTLAYKNKAVYSRYGDDITFSFYCESKNISEEIVQFDRVREKKYQNKYRDFDQEKCGEKLTEIIKSNGFEINQEKVRLNTIGQRLEVTGLTVNEFVNVRRKYVRNIKSMLYAWEKWGYENAEKEYLLKYFFKKNYSPYKPNFSRVVKGKLAFLKMVRGQDDKIYRNLAMRFNRLVDPKIGPIKYTLSNLTEKKLTPNKWQQKIFELENGQYQISIPQGFDRTNILTHRIALAVERKIKQEEIVHLTHSKHAANNIRKNLPSIISGVFIGTFNDYFIHILKHIGRLNPGVHILDDNSEKAIQREAIKRTIINTTNGDVSRQTEHAEVFLRNFLYDYANLRNMERLNLHDEIIEDTRKSILEIWLKYNFANMDQDVGHLMLHSAYNHYEHHKRSSFFYDSNDLINYTLAEVVKLKSSQKIPKIKWIQVEGFEMTNLVQRRILKHLADRYVHAVVFTQSQSKGNSISMQTYF